MLICDLEANGLVQEATRIWVICAYHTDMGMYTFSFDSAVQIPEEFEWPLMKCIFKSHKEHLEYMREYTICFHNWFQFDKLILKRFYPEFVPKGEEDSYILSQLFNPDRGLHGLEAWGTRFGIPKPPIEDWSKFDEDMLHRVIEDVKINIKVWDRLMGEKKDWEKLGHSWDKAIKIEYKVADLQGRQEQHGVLFDIDKAYDLAEEIWTEVFKIDAKLDEVMPMRLVKYNSVQYESKPFTKGGELKSAVVEWFNTHLVVCGPFTRVTWENINHNSYTQVKDFLLTQGWIPTEYTDNGSPQLTEDSFPSIKGELGQLIAKRAVLKHRAQMLFNITKKGEMKGLINLVRADGRIEAGAITNGTNTGRMQHRHIVNIPKPFDVDLWPSNIQIRSLFIVPNDKIMMGADADGLEARIMAHFVKPYKGGEAYAYEILEGDIHSANAEIFETDRQGAKAPFYCLPMHTTALTKRGWKSYEDIREGELVLTYNSKTGMKEWKPVIAKHYFDNAEVIKMSCKGWEFESTEDHRWFVRQRKQGNKGWSKINGRYMEEQVRTTSEINTESSIINNAPMTPDIDSDWTPRLTIAKYGTDWVREVCEMSSEERRAFLNGFLIADGHMTEEGKWCFAQLPNEHFEAVLTASYIEHNGKIGVWSGPNRVLRGELNVKGHTTGQKLRKESVGKQPVWCLTTENESFVARQGNRITITGNCLMYGGQIGKLAETLGCSKKKATRIFNRFWDESEALSAFKKRITKFWKSTGGKYIVGIDGRRINIRSEHSIVNAAFQSAGSITVKVAAIYLDKWCRDLKINAQQVIIYHDEIEYEALKRDEEKLADLTTYAFKRAGEFLNIRVPITSTPIYGKNWEEVH